MTGGVLTSAVLGHSTVRSCKYMDVSAIRVENGCKVVVEGACIRGAKGGSIGKRKGPGLYSSLTSGWQDSRLCSKVLLKLVPAASGKGEHHRPLVVDDFGGNYEESFADVQKHLLDYFTYKAVRTVLAQLSEMNPHQYAWFYNFVVNNKPQDSKFFIRTLVKERQELGERVMVTRLHLFNKWVKKYNHAELHKAISDQNLELLRERLIQTVKFSNSVGDDVEPNPP